MEEVFAEKLAMILLEQAELLSGDEANDDFESEYDDTEIVVIKRKEK